MTLPWLFMVHLLILQLATSASASSTYCSSDRSRAQRGPSGEGFTADGFPSLLTVRISEGGVLGGFRAIGEDHGTVPAVMIGYNRRHVIHYLLCTPLPRDCPSAFLPPSLHPSTTSRSPPRTCRSPGLGQPPMASLSSLCAACYATIRYQVCGELPTFAQALGAWHVAKYIVHHGSRP